MVDEKFQSSVSKLVSKMSFPCFIFIQIIRGFSFDRYRIFLESLLGCVLNYAISYVVGYVSMKILKYPEKQCRFVGAFFSSPHTTSMPVTLLPFIAPVLDKVAIPAPGMPASAELRGYLYIITNSICSNIWRWSGVNYLVDAEDDSEDAVSSHNEKLPEGEKLLNETNAVQKVENKNQQNNDEFSWEKFFRQVINMPIIASFGSLGLILIPGVQYALNVPGSWLDQAVVGATQIAANTYTQLVIISLGLSISDFCTFHPDPEKVKKIIFRGWDMLWLSLIKLIINPLVFTPVNVLAFKVLLKSDDLALFLFMYLAACPSAINVRNIYFYF
ncbi:MAG: AEC family transporter [archaeon]|nr:AEC family transporter [archaeon]